jgi:hypothetical protein
VEDDPTQQLKYLRPRARKIGIVIRKQRASRSSTEPLYRLLDRDNAAVVRRDVALIDISTELFWITRERRRALERPAAEPIEEVCPSCATPRIAFFRYCKTCGLDYEAGRTPVPGVDGGGEFLWLRDATALQRPSRVASQPVALATHHASTSESASSPLVVTAEPEATRRWYRFVSPPEVALGVILGALVGMIATIVGARS